MTSQGTGAAPSATPFGASQETCNKDRELGREAGHGRLSLVPRAHRRHTSHLARLLPCGVSRRIRTEAGRHPGHDVRGMRRSCRGARPQARDQRRPGDGTGGPQASVHAGEPPLALQLLPPAQDQAGPQARAVPGGLLAGLATCQACQETQTHLGGRVPRSVGNGLTPARTQRSSRTSAPRRRGYGRSEQHGNMLKNITQVEGES